MESFIAVSIFNVVQNYFIAGLSQQNVDNSFQEQKKMMLYNKMSAGKIKIIFPMIENKWEKRENSHLFRKKETKNKYKNKAAKKALLKTSKI